MYQRVTTSPDSLRAKLDETEHRLQSQSIEAARLSILERDVKELETLLNYQQTITVQSKTARILARSADSEQLILIDKGENDGLSEGLAVAVADGHLIGVISQVQKNTSTVKLISDQTSKIPAMVLSDAKITGLVEGKGGFLLKMDFIPHETNISADQIVITSGLDGAIPPGLVIGSVSSVNKVDTELFISAEIQPFVAPDDYQRVLILDPLAQTEYDS